MVFLLAEALLSGVHVNDCRFQNFLVPVVHQGGVGGQRLRLSLAEGSWQAYSHAAFSFQKDCNTSRNHDLV
jgi:hypothetical protein